MQPDQFVSGTSTGPSLVGTSRTIRLRRDDAVAARSVEGRPLRASAWRSGAVAYRGRLHSSALQLAADTHTCGSFSAPPPLPPATSGRGKRLHAARASTPGEPVQFPRFERRGLCRRGGLLRPPGSQPAPAHRQHFRRLPGDQQVVYPLAVGPVLLPISDGQAKGGRGLGTAPAARATFGLSRASASKARRIVLATQRGQHVEGRPPIPGRRQAPTVAKPTGRKQCQP